MNRNSLIVVGVLVLVVCLSYNIYRKTHEALTGTGIIVIIMASIGKILLNRRWTRW